MRVLRMQEEAKPQPEVHRCRSTLNGKTRSWRSSRPPGGARLRSTRNAASPQLAPKRKIQHRGFQGSNPSAGLMSNDRRNALYGVDRQVVRQVEAFRCGDKEL